MSEKESSIDEFINSQLSVDGTLYPGFVTKERLEELKTFPLRPDDVFVSSYPSSGTHWTMKIVFLVLHNGEDKHLNYTPCVDKDYFWLHGAKINGPLRHDMPSPRILISHAYYEQAYGGPPTTSPAKYIYVARNPKDAAVSLYNHQSDKKMPFQKYSKFNLTSREFMQCYLDGKVAFGLWWKHVPGWWAHKDEPNVLFLKYEDMKKDLASNVRAIAEFLGKDLDQVVIEKIAQACTIENVKAKAVDWREDMPLRKGVVGNWKNLLTPEQSAAFDVRYLEAVRGTGLEFDFD